MKPDDVVLYTLGAVIVVAVLYLAGTRLVKLWYAEKEKHLDRVLKKIKQGEVK